MKARGCIETIDGDLLVDTCAFTLRAVEHLPDWRRRDAYPHACIRDVGKGSSAVKAIPWEQKANTEIGIRARTKGPWRSACDADRGRRCSSRTFRTCPGNEQEVQDLNTKVITPDTLEEQGLGSEPD